MKRNVLTYFMWAYQTHFRGSMEFRTRDVLSALGVVLDPKAVLVGVRVPEVTADHPVCVEPEDGEWDLSMFSRCHDRTEELFKVHPDHALYYGDEPRMRDKPENIRRKSVLEAVEEAFAPFDTDHSTRTFCGTPVRVGNYHVVPVLQASRTALEESPRLPEPIEYRGRTSARGIVETLILHLLSEASVALGTKEPGRYFDIFDADASGLLRQAAQGLCNAIPLAVQDFMLQGVFDDLNRVSSLRYEGGEAMGEIVFAAPNAPSLEHQIRFSKSVPLSSPRLVRKIVEMSGNDLACVCDGSGGLKGLATVTVHPANPVFRVVFTGHYRWELYFNEVLLMKSAFGVPAVPSPRLTEGQFSSNIRRILVGLTEPQCHVLWGVISAAMDQRHGTMLVVSDAADTEAKRLSSQSISVQPTLLTPALVRRISGIDGAIVVDRDAQCHALGVILDGLACDVGDPSRGARFNSAVRYTRSATAPTVCLVVSEDGDVNMVPTLRPQINRKEVQARVEQLAELTADNYHETRSWLDRNRFYLTAEQCEFLNTQLERIHAEPAEVVGIRLVTRPFSAHPEMNESYYLEDAVGGAG